MSGITLKKHKFGILPVNVLLFFFHQEPLCIERVHLFWIIIIYFLLLTRLFIYTNQQQKMYHCTLWKETGDRKRPGSSSATLQIKLRKGSWTNVKFKKSLAVTHFTFSISTRLEPVSVLGDWPINTENFNNIKKR